MLSSFHSLSFLCLLCISYLTLSSILFHSWIFLVFFLSLLFLVFLSQLYSLLDRLFFFSSWFTFSIYWLNSLSSCFSLCFLPHSLSHPFLFITIYFFVNIFFGKHTQAHTHTDIQSIMKTLAYEHQIVHNLIIHRFMTLMKSKKLSLWQDLALCLREYSKWRHVSQSYEKRILSGMNKWQTLRIYDSLW